VYQRILSLPIYPKMTQSSIEQVIEGIRKIVHQHRR
jgi:dTDP-4-amino-4,6-dideoxygalactose transaminase